MKDVKIMRLEAAIYQARRFIAAAEYAARQLRTGKEDASRSYAHAEAKRQSMTLSRKLAMVRRSAYAGGDRP
jgi:hypothetical protein